MADTKKFRVTASKTDSVEEFYDTAQEAADKVSELLATGFEYVHVTDTENEVVW